VSHIVALTLVVALTPVVAAAEPAQYMINPPLGGREDRPER
jgi:hypothetical protein